MTTSSTDRIDQLLLVWLMVPRKESPVSGFYDQLKPLAEGKDERKRLANESVARLRERGMIEPGRELQLTDAGRRSALDALGNATPPAKLTLPWVKRVLFLRGIGAEPTLAAISRAGSADVRAARVLLREYELDRKLERFASDPRKHKQVASKVAAALARRALGVEETFDALKLNDAFAAVFLMARSATTLEDNITNGHSGPASGTVALHLADSSLNDFAQRVTEAARSSTTRRWHGAVFISDVWEALKGRGEVGITFEKFKRRLIEAHQQDLLELSRADLVDAMSPADVSASETIHSGARFHFVRLEQLAS
jgi:hypothetical protein